MRTPFLLVLVLVSSALATSGCFGSVDAVYVPRSDVLPGWSHSTVNETQEVARGTLEIVTNRYGYDDRVSGEVYLIGVTDVPGVDEGQEIRDQIQAHADAQGVQLDEAGTRDVTLDNGKVARATEYAITKQVTWGTARGKAWFLEWDTGDFSAGGLGWATTEYETLLGKETDLSAWEDAQEMLRAAEW